MKPVHGAMVVTAAELVVATDRDGSMGRATRVPIDQADCLHDSIRCALQSALPTGGNAVLVDTDDDPSCLAVCEKGGTELIDPDLLRAQSQIDVRLVSPHDAWAALIASGQWLPMALTAHDFDQHAPYCLLQIAETPTRVTIDTCLVGTDGKAVPNGLVFEPCPINANMVSHAIASLLLSRPEGAAQVAVGLMHRTRFGAAVIARLSDACASSPRSIAAYVDPLGTLQGALIMSAQQARA